MSSSRWFGDERFKEIVLTREYSDKFYNLILAWAIYFAMFIAKFWASFVFPII